MRADGWSPEFLPHGRAARRVQTLPGGFANPVWWCELDDGREVAVKASAGASADMFVLEAAGLAALTELGGLTTPHVIAVGPQSIVLEALEPHVPDDEAFWRS